MTEAPEITNDKRTRGSALALGAATLFASSVFRQVLGVVTLIVTARLLTPEDFGVIAYFLLATAFLEMLHRQIMISLIRQDEISNEHLNTVFTVQVIFSLVVALLIWATVPLLSVFDLSSLAILVLPVILYTLILPLSSPRFLVFERELRFGPTAVIETIMRVAYSIAVVILAWIWRDFWAVIIATFIGRILSGLWTFKLAPMELQLTLAKWQDSITFSTWAMGAQIAQFFSQRLPLLFIGSAFGLAEAGLFRLGNRLTALVTTQLFAPMQRVLYPGLANVSRSTGKNVEMFMKMNTALLAIVLPISFGMAFLAEDIILVAMGSKWIAAAQVIWILAPLKAFETLHANVRAAIYVDGKTRPLFVRNTVLLGVAIVLMTIGVRFGFSGALISAGLSSIAATTLSLFMARRFSTGGFFAPLVASWRSFGACFTMAVAIFGIEYAVTAERTVVILVLVLIAKILAGAITYLTVHFALWVMSGRPDGFERFVTARIDSLRSATRTSEEQTPKMDSQSPH